MDRDPEMLPFDHFAVASGSIRLGYGHALFQKISRYISPKE
jgi:hypothetical protein